VLTSHPTLLIGPSDWDADVMPREEFARRIDALWRAFPEAPCAIVCGSPAHHAELAYLTNLVPKLEAAVAILSRSGAREIHLGGGPNMLGSAKSLTFITDIKPLRGGQAIGRRALEMKEGMPGTPLIIGDGYMPTAFHQSMDETMGEGALNATAQIWAFMHRSSTHEVHAMRESAFALNGAMTAITDANKAGAGVTEAILAGEREANSRGAQDIRTLFSLDGGRTLQPFTTTLKERLDPLQVYVAARRFNYWTEGFLAISETRPPLIARARELLRQALAAIKPGVKTADVMGLIHAGVRPYQMHPVTERAIISRLGLALEEPPHTNPGITFDHGDIYSVRVGVTNGSNEHAIMSAIVRVREGGTDMHWTA
jgi:riboflavin biosynthesis pyrimidine reductase